MRAAIDMSVAGVTLIKDTYGSTRFFTGPSAAYLIRFINNIAAKQGIENGFQLAEKRTAVLREIKRAERARQSHIRSKYR
jgi:hypothetical protein